MTGQRLLSVEDKLLWEVVYLKTKIREYWPALREKGFKFLEPKKPIINEYFFSDEGKQNSWSSVYASAANNSSSLPSELNKIIEDKTEDLKKFCDVLKRMVLSFLSNNSLHFCKITAEARNLLKNYLEEISKSQPQNTQECIIKIKQVTAFVEFFTTTEKESLVRQAEYLKVKKSITSSFNNSITTSSFAKA